MDTYDYGYMATYFTISVGFGIILDSFCVRFYFVVWELFRNYLEIILEPIWIHEI